MSRKYGLGEAPSPGNAQMVGTTVSAIVGNSPQRVTKDIQTIDLNLIEESDRFRLRLPPYPKLEELARDIELRGQTTPLFVRPKNDGRYELISGYRRAAALHLTTCTLALVRIFSGLSDEDAYDLAISENQERENLTDIERADICLRLQNEGKSNEAIAQRMGWSDAKHARRYLRLAKQASPLLRKMMQNRDLSLAAAMALLEFVPEGMFSTEAQEDIFRTVVENEYSAAQIKSYIARIRRNQEALRGSVEPDPNAEAWPSLIKSTKTGGLTLRAIKIEPTADLPEVDNVIAALTEGLKRAKQIKRKIEAARFAPSESVDDSQTDSSAV